MRKYIFFTLLACLLLFFCKPVSAHLTGAFAEFLAVVYDESTTADLKRQLEDTKAEIAVITPKVESLEQQFTQQQSLAIDQLIAYNDIGLDTWYLLLADNEDMVDLLGDQWIMTKAINHYLASLNDLYLLYEEVKLEQTTLQGQEELLKMIDKSIKRRASYMAENEGLDIEKIANYLDIDWFSEVEEPLIQAMTADKNRVKKELMSLFVKKGDALFLQEATLNKESKAHYFLRADHIYIEFEIKDEHVILIGQILQNRTGTKAKLTFEAGYYNGFFLPTANLMELPAIEFDYATLKKFPKIQSPYLTQQNGFIHLNSK